MAVAARPPLPPPPPPPSPTMLRLLAAEHALDAGADAAMGCVQAVF
jgi:hypothetical protein